MISTSIRWFGGPLFSETTISKLCILAVPRGNKTSRCYGQLLWFSTSHDQSRPLARNAPQYRRAADNPKCSMVPIYFPTCAYKNDLNVVYFPTFTCKNDPNVGKHIPYMEHLSMDQKVESGSVMPVFQREVRWASTGRDPRDNLRQWWTTNSAWSTEWYANYLRL